VKIKLIITFLFISSGLWGMDQKSQSALRDEETEENRSNLFKAIVDENSIVVVYYGDKHRVKSNTAIDHTYDDNADIIKRLNDSKNQVRYDCIIINHQKYRPGYKKDKNGTFKISSSLCGDIKEAVKFVKKNKNTCMIFNLSPTPTQENITYMCNDAQQAHENGLKVVIYAPKDLDIHADLKKAFPRENFTTIQPQEKKLITLQLPHASNSFFTNVVVFGGIGITVLIGFLWYLKWHR